MLGRLITRNRDLNKFSRISKQISTITLDNNKTERFYTEKDFQMNNNFKKKHISVLGYGPQGRAHALNLRDGGFRVSLGLREGSSWNQAILDGWLPEYDLFHIDEATHYGTIICNLLSDAGQIDQWNHIKSNLYEGNTLYFSHGFGVTFNHLTKIDPPDNIDVIMVSPKASGITVRNNFLDGNGISCSYAVDQDYSGNAEETALSMAFSIGANMAFKTTFEKEVFSDLLGERCVLMGLIQGAFSAQYKFLRNNGHSALEAYNETVEEALNSLYPLINENGMDHLYRNCSTTAQRGALDWAPKFENSIYPIIEKCYDQVKSGEEAKRVIRECSKDDYRDRLNDELEIIDKSELWSVARQVRSIKDKKKKNTWEGALL